MSIYLPNDRKREAAGGLLKTSIQSFTSTYLESMLILSRNLALSSEIWENVKLTIYVLFLTN